VLIFFALVLLNNRYHPSRSPASFWHFDTTSFRSALRPHAQTTTTARRKWGIGTDRTNGVTYQNTPIEVPNDGIIVMGKLRDEDTAWVSAELAE
jgi:hypothetical protein